MTSTSPAHDTALRRLATTLETSTSLDPVRRRLGEVTRTLEKAPDALALLRGAGLGHPAHPAMTDVPIGLWVAGTTLDLVGPASAHAAADRLLALGVVAAVPTAVTGLADWSASSLRVQRVGTAHVVLNNAALALYATSLLLRRRGLRGPGVAVSLLAGGVVLVSAYLGGHMAFVLRAPDEAVAAGAEEWLASGA